MPCMIFAAGFGTRMQPLTDDRPKPLIEVAGKPLIRHALEPAFKAGIGPIVVNAHYKAPMMQSALEPFDVTVTVEDPILETGGGLKAALPLLVDDPVFTMNSDAVWKGPNPFQVLQDAWDPERMEALLLCLPVKKARGRTDDGDFSLSVDGTLSRGPGVIYLGVHLTKTGRIADWPEAKFSLNAPWNEMISEGSLFGVLYDGDWCDVGRPKNITEAEEMLNV